jgi:hypothetical protein
MARIIEFHIPTNFRSPRKWVPQVQLGRVIEFCPQAKKSA